MADEATLVDNVTRNADGSVIVKLATPITVDGDEVTRVTVPALKGRHMMLCPFKASDPGSVEIGAFVSFAALIVKPKGAIEEMSPADALAVAAEVGNSMNKSPA